LSLYTKYWTWINLITLVVFSVAVYFAYVLLSHIFVGTFNEYTPLTMLKSPHFYLVVFFLSSCVLIGDILQG
jgi:phospholipid-transporting ATPase